MRLTQRKSASNTSSEIWTLCTQAESSYWPHICLHSSSPRALQPSSLKQAKTPATRTQITGITLYNRVHGWTLVSPSFRYPQSFRLTNSPPPRTPGKNQIFSVISSVLHTSPLGKNSKMFPTMAKRPSGKRRSPVHLAHFPVHMMTWFGFVA